jgi:cytochrome c-type biogenesis protein CcmH
MNRFDLKSVLKIPSLFLVAKAMVLLCLSLAVVSCTQSNETNQEASQEPASAESENIAKSISGVIKIDSELTEKLSQSDVLFIIARKAGQDQGPPTAVIRVKSPEFPHSFEMNATHVMVPGQNFEGPLQVSAKISKTGDAISSPGDLISSNTDQADLGEEDVEVVINKVIE